MNDKILALKYRPHFFNEVVGQESCVKSLSNSINLNKIHNAYLFSGTRGVGKTTIARIFAKSLLCKEGIVTPHVASVIHVLKLIIIIILIS